MGKLLVSGVESALLARSTYVQGRCAQHSARPPLISVSPRSQRIPRQVSPIRVGNRWNSSTSTSTSTSSSTDEQNESSDQKPKKRLRINPAIYLAVAAVLAYPSYIIAQYLANVSNYPDSVRKPLRQALMAKKWNRFDEADIAFRKAITAALALPSSDLEPEPFLKLSGIYATYAQFLEANGALAQAYETLYESLTIFGEESMSPDPSKRISGKWGRGRLLNQEEYIRVIGIHQKLGQLALSISSRSRVTPYPDDYASGSNGAKTFLDAAEFHLSSALTAMLKLGLGASANSEAGPSKPVVIGRDLNLPENRSSTSQSDEEAEFGGIVDTQGLGVTMEALSQVYAKKGNYNYAGQLLIQAISTLLPPGETNPKPMNLCQAAMLMTSISAYTQKPGTKKARNIAQTWAQRALELSADGKRGLPAGIESTDQKYLCGKAASVALFNLAMLEEMDSKVPQALDDFGKSLTLAREVGFKEGELQSAEAIKRIKYPSSL